MSEPVSFCGGDLTAVVAGRVALLVALAPSDPVVRTLWDLGRGGAPIEELLAALVAPGVGALTDFGLWFDEGDVARVVLRGGVVAELDRPDGAREVLSAPSVVTWAEHVVAGGTGVSFVGSQPAAEDLGHRLADGIVAAGRIVAGRAVGADASSERSAVAGPASAPPVPPGSEVGGAFAPPFPEPPVAEPAGVEGAFVPADPAEPALPDAGPPTVVPSEIGLAAVDEVDAAPDAVADDNYDHLFGVTQFRSVESAVRSAGPQDGHDAPPQAPSNADGIIDGIPAPSGPTVPGPAAAPVPPIVGAPPVTGMPPDPGDHDGRTMTAAELARLTGSVGGAAGVAPVPVAAAVSGPVVHAVLCPSGHPNPANFASCRQCGAPVAEQDPVTIPRPSLGVLRFSDGSEVTLDRPILVGRAPRIEGSITGEVPQLVAIDSPEQDVSRSHVEVRVEGWQVLVTDLRSTNGTTAILPGQSPTRLHPGEPTLIGPGSRVVLGDHVSFDYEVV